jgi:RimJ/RimL family protein N-acetyltransferase
LQPFVRAQHGADLRAALAQDSDGAGWAYLMPQPQSEADWNHWFDTMETSSDPLFFAIVERASGQASGIASYLRIDPANGVIEVGFLRFAPGLQRTAAATEAMYLMMRQAFSWGYRRYEWKCNALNAPSLRAASRLGFRYEGTFRQARVNWGRNRDTAWFSLLDHEWPAARAALQTWLAPENFAADGGQRRSLQQCREAQTVLETGIRPATLADLEQLAPLFDQYRAFYGRLDDSAATLAFMRERLLRGDSRVLLAVQDGRLQGFTQLFPLFSSTLAAPVWLLNDLFVAADARRCGVATRLLQAAAQLARAHGVVRLDLATAVDNLAAQKTYEGLGWERNTAFFRYQLML